MSHFIDWLIFSSVSRKIESLLIYSAFLLLCFGIPDAVPYGVKDAVATGVLGALAVTLPRTA